jgi:hypothetical protein
MLSLIRAGFFHPEAVIVITANAGIEYLGKIVRRSRGVRLDPMVAVVVPRKRCYRKLQPVGPGLADNVTFEEFGSTKLPNCR